MKNLLKKSFMALLILPMFGVDGAYASITPKTYAKQAKSFRIGLGLAGEYLLTDNAEQNDPRIVSANLIGKANQNNRNVQFAPFIETGYQFQNGTYLALIVSYHHTPNKIMFHKAGISNAGVRPVVREGSRVYSFSTLLKGGYKLQTQPLMLYALIGANFSKWDTKITKLLITTVRTSNVTPHNATGLTFGLGVEYLVTQNISLALDWTKTIYEPVNKRSFSSVLGVNRSHQVFSFKVGYYF